MIAQETVYLTLTGGGDDTPGGNTTFAGGSGTAADPYLISTPAQLDAVRNNLSAHYKLTSDINLAGWDWVPIGSIPYSGAVSFTGVFDGNNHIIKNMSIADTKKYGSSGLFAGIQDGAVKNLDIVNCDIKISTSPGITIRTGSIAGDLVQGEISNCYNTGNIYIDSSSVPPAFVGGIVGSIANSSIKSCFNTGSVKNLSSFPDSDFAEGYTGGITGVASNSSISNCYNAGSVEAVSDYTIGGIVGQIGYNSSVSSCYNRGNVKFNNPSFYGCGGSVTGYLYSSSSAQYCYFPDTDTKGIGDSYQSTATNVRALTSTQLKQQSAYVGFDFTNTWAISPTINNGYPYLRGMQP